MDWDWLPPAVFVAGAVVAVVAGWRQIRAAERAKAEQEAADRFRDGHLPRARGQQ